jgi:glycosyltransferase involved in cell wall biosynthesis
LKPGFGPSDEQLNELVNSFDVHMLLTNSEGWGLPLLETAAAGVPNLTTKYSAHGDWGKDTLMFCKTAELEHEPKTGFIKCIADTSSAAKQLSLLYNSKDLYKDYSKKGVKLGKKLDWDNVVKQWETLLDAVDISDLKPNRYKDPTVFPQSNDPKDMTLTVFPKGENS